MTCSTSVWASSIISWSCFFQWNVWWTRFCRINKNCSDLFPPVNPRVSLTLRVPSSTRSVGSCPSLPHQLSHIFISGVLQLIGDQTHFPLHPGFWGFTWLLAFLVSSGPLFSQLLWHQDSVFGSTRSLTFLASASCVWQIVLDIYLIAALQFVWTQLCLLWYL